MRKSKDSLGHQRSRSSTAVAPGRRHGKLIQQQLNCLAGNNRRYTIFRIPILSLLILCWMITFHYSIIVIYAEIDAETGKECVDHDVKNCPLWAATGECKKNRSFMHANCRKSCDRCKIVRVNNVKDINKFMLEKKGEIENKRKTRQQQKDFQNILDETIISNDPSNKPKRNKKKTNAGAGLVADKVDSTRIKQNDEL